MSTTTASRCLSIGDQLLDFMHAHVLDLMLLIAGFLVSTVLGYLVQNRSAR